MSGDQLVLPITTRDNDGALVDLTGASARFAMARQERSTVLDIDSEASPPTATVILTDAVNGLITVTMTDENTDVLEGDFYYECKVTDNAGQEVVVARGWISFAINLT